jgi:hypothetical protein
MVKKISYNSASSGISRIPRGVYVVKLSKHDICLLQRPNTISEANVFKEEGVLQ